ncbi:MAG: DUF1016 family protein [Bacteroidales bacterium]|nr:DUF1016 family protein [Bacteroidales bacterium]
MSQLINVSDEYRQWVMDVCGRFRKSQIKAAVSVNISLIEFYWGLGKDIIAMNLEKKYGSGTMGSISQDLQRNLPGVKGLSQKNLYYIKKFYNTYSKLFENFPQVVGNFGEDRIMHILFSIPWGHHRNILDKFSENPQRAFYYVLQTHINGWSRSVLLNMVELDSQEPLGKAISNFELTLPDTQSDLAQEITKDPYTFDFAAVTQPYRENELKKALEDNIRQFLLELGSGFAYMGREYRLVVGDTEQFIDLLFYNTQIRSYVVIEVKVTKFKPGDLGQLGTYVSAINHQLKGEHDNPTIGLLICKDKDTVLAQYALESTSQPIGISEYELSKLFPENFKGTLPSIEDIENEIKDK